MNTFIKYRKYFWTTVWVLGGLGFGLTLVAYKNNVEVSSAFLWAMAYFILGALAGFTFGVPKIISLNDQMSALQVGTLATQTSQRNAIQENTNLTQISDWLTKIIIGAGLVQLRDIPFFIMRVAKRMALGMAENATKIESVNVFCAAIIIFFTTFGFASGYIIMRLIISELLLDASDEEN
jgi:hypothetical protein